MRIRAFCLGVLSVALAGVARAEVFYTVDESQDTLCTVDTATGVVTPIGPLGVGFQFGDLAYDSSQGVMYMVDGWANGSSTPSNLYRVDLGTGVATLVGSTGATSLFSLAFDPVSSRLYAATSTSSPTAFYELNRTTGVATYIGDPGVSLDGLTHLGGSNQIVGLFAGPGSLHVVDPATGAGSLLDAGGGFVNNCGIAWGPNTNSIYSIDWSGELYRFDVAGGFARTTLWSLGGPFDGLAFAGAGCPNPTVYCTAGTTTNGCVPTIGASGPLSVASASGCTVDVAQVEGQRAGLMLYGITGGVAFPWGSGSTSFFCVKSPTQRTAQQNTGGLAGQCDGALSLDLRSYLAANPTALGNPLNVGTSFSVQGWFRDPPAPRSTNLSDAVRIQACP